MRFALALLALLALPLAAHAQDATAVVGEAAPDFTLTDTNGTTHTLSDYQGQIVVLEWTNPGCPFVVRHYADGTMPALRDRLGDDVVWLAINSTHAGHADAALIEGGNEGQTWPTLLDGDGAVGRTYGARTTPHMYVVDAEGTLAYAGAIDSDPRGSQALDDRTQYVEDAVIALAAAGTVPTSTSDPYGCSVKYAD